jgi:hypothetical protein
MSEQDERTDQDPPDETPEGGPPSGEPDPDDHPVREVPEWR